MNLKEIVPVVLACGVALTVILSLVAFFENSRQNYLIETGFCEVVFVEDSGSKDYICEDGTRFERDYD